MLIHDSAINAGDAEDSSPLASAETQRKLSLARVLVVGLEPWGAIAAAELAAAGVGALRLLDDREVAPDDLGPFAEADLGKGRGEALAAALSRLAPGCAVTSGTLRAAADQPLAEDDTAWDLVLACVAGDDLLVLQSVARFAHAAGVMSVSAHLDGLDAMIGPVVVPGKTACWNCCRLRRLATSRHDEADHALQASLLAERPPRRARTYLAPTPALLGHALALAATGLLVDPGAAALEGRLLVQSLIDLEVTFHAVLPMPWCPVCGGASAALRGGPVPPVPRVRLDPADGTVELRRRLAGVVDERTGIVQKLALDALSPALAPEAPITATAVLSPYTDGEYRAHRCGEPKVGAGKGVTPADALIRAVGEAVERYSAGRFRTEDHLRASVAEMKADFIAPERLCLYAEEQYARPDFPFARLDPGTPIPWVLGQWLDTREPVYVPAHPTYFNYPCRPEEYFCDVTSNGLAAGPTLDEAVMGAALELLERDAFMISWLARLPGKRLVLDGSLDPYAREVARQLAERGARLELYLVDAGVAVPTVVCIGYGDGKRWPGATASIAAHLSPRTAIRKAILEQGHIGPYLLRLMTGEETVVPERPEDVHSLEDHALYYIPPSRAGALDVLGAGGEVDVADLEEPAEISLSAIVERVGAAGLRMAMVDVTSPDLATTPFRVARVLGPDFQQIHFGHDNVRLGNPRLRAMAPQGFNPEPHPMA